MIAYFVLLIVPLVLLAFVMSRLGKGPPKRRGASLAVRRPIPLG
jgi:hypothetical protein